jgi:hypothetical protein
MGGRGMKWVCKSFDCEKREYGVESARIAALQYGEDCSLPNGVTIEVEAGDLSESCLFVRSVSVVPIKEVFCCRWEGRKEATYLAAYNMNHAAQVFSGFGREVGVVCVKGRDRAWRQVVVVEGGER